MYYVLGAVLDTRGAVVSRTQAPALLYFVAPQKCKAAGNEHNALKGIWPNPGGSGELPQARDFRMAL